MTNYKEHFQLNYMYVCFDSNLCRFLNQLKITRALSLTHSLDQEEKVYQNIIANLAAEY